MVCLRCLLVRFIEKSKKKVEEWADTPAVANTIRRRLHELENELVGLDPCKHD